MKLKDLITTEEQYEVNKARAELSLYFLRHVDGLDYILDRLLATHSRKV